MAVRAPRILVTALTALLKPQGQKNFREAPIHPEMVQPLCNVTQKVSRNFVKPSQYMMMDDDHLRSKQMHLWAILQINISCYLF